MYDLIFLDGSLHLSTFVMLQSEAFETYQSYKRMRDERLGIVSLFGGINSASGSCSELHITPRLLMVFRSGPISLQQMPETTPSKSVFRGNKECSG